MSIEHSWYALYCRSRARQGFTLPRFYFLKRPWLWPGYLWRCFIRPGWFFYP